MAELEGVVMAETSVALAEHPRMRWGSVIAGWLVATGIAFLLYVGGLAIGFSSLDPSNTEAVTKGIGIGTCVWLVLTWVVALFIGGLFSSWSDGRDDPTMGTVQGVTVWGLAIAASGLLLAMGLGGAMRSGTLLLSGPTSMQPGASAVGASSRGAENNDTVNLLQAQLVQQVKQQAPVSGQGPAQPPMPAGPGPMPVQPTPEAGMPGMGPVARVPPPAVGPRTAHAVTLALLAGHPDTAKALLSGNTGLSPTAADSVVQGLSPQVEHARNELKTAADTVAHYSALAMWILLAAVLLSLLAAALGGWLGTSHVHRVYHLRRYARSVPRR